MVEVTDKDREAANLLVPFMAQPRDDLARRSVERVLAHHRIAALEEAARVMDARAQRYRSKAVRYDADDPDDMYNTWDGFQFSAKASECGAAAIRALIAPQPKP